MRTSREKSITACSVAGGGWLIRSECGQAAWVDTMACQDAAPQEVDRIASLGRALILSRDSGGGSGATVARLQPGELPWLLAKPRRIACLIDFLAASEDLVRVLTTPLRVTFTPMGDVRWRFVPARRTDWEPVAATGVPASLNEHRRAVRLAA
jgi:hypothetical protein